MENKEKGMACFAIGGSPEGLQTVVDLFYSKCDGFIKVIKHNKYKWIVCFKTKELAEEAQQAMDMIKAGGIPQ